MGPNLWRRFLRRLKPISSDTTWATNLPTPSRGDRKPLSNSQIASIKEAWTKLWHRYVAYLLPFLLTVPLRYAFPEHVVIWGITARKIFLFSIFLALAITVLALTHFSLKYSIIARYGILLRRLGENKSNFRDTPMKRRTNYDLRKLAKRLSRLPLTLGTRHPVVVLSAAHKSAYVRNLQVWVSQPLDDNTFDCLYDTLLDSLKTFLDKRWEDLPGEEPDESDRITRWQRVGYVLLGLAFAIGAVALVIYGKDIQGSGALVSLGWTLLLAGAYLSLAKAGLIPGSLQAALDTAKKITG
jgi:hypothetical protein